MTISRASAAHLVERLGIAYALTQRELQIVGRLLAGLSTRAVAKQLVISPYTVQAHLTSIFRKTGVRSRAELVSRLR